MGKPVGMVSKDGVVHDHGVVGREECKKFFLAQLRDVVYYNSDMYYRYKEGFEGGEGYTEVEVCPWSSGVSVGYAFRKWHDDSCYEWRVGDILGYGEYEYWVECDGLPLPTFVVD